MIQEKQIKKKLKMEADKCKNSLQNNSGKQKEDVNKHNYHLFTLT